MVMLSAQLFKKHKEVLRKVTSCESQNVSYASQNNALTFSRLLFPPCCKRPINTCCLFCFVIQPLHSHKKR